MKIGFDNDKYLKEQSEEIRRRAGKYGRLYLVWKKMKNLHLDSRHRLKNYSINISGWSL